MGSFINNGCDTPINVQTGTIPNMSMTLNNWLQPMTFEPVTKTITAFRVVEEGEAITFRGVIQPLSNRDLYMKPEGQRAWTWLWIHATPNLKLDVDDVITYLGEQTRVMAVKDYGIYGYVSYEVIQDYTGAGPEVAP
jgi:hypothetical protein